MDEQKDIFEFTENGHSYTLNGKKLTGVTTVLGIVSKGDGLVQWSANVACDYIYEMITKVDIDEMMNVVIPEAKAKWKSARDDAGNSGKATHAIAEIIIKDAIKEHGGLIDPKWEMIVNALVESEHTRAQIQQFMTWAMGVKFLESEKKIYSKTNWTGGTVDFVYEKDGEVYVGDIKTAKTIYPTNFWQTSAYQLMLQEMGLYPIVKGFTIVRLGRTGEFEVQQNFSYDDNIEGFLAALTVYRKLNLITPPKKVYKKKVPTVSKVDFGSDDESNNPANPAFGI